MTTFNEANTIEEAIRDRLCGLNTSSTIQVKEPSITYGDFTISNQWTFVHGTELPRDTQDVLIESWLKDALCRLNPDIAKEPEKADEVIYKLRGVLMEGIQYERIANHYWKMSRIEDEAEKGIVRYLNNLYAVQNPKKYLFDQVEYDSEVEKQFAKDLDNNEYVRLFVKLPSWFKIDTPIGPYNPDWAFVTHRDEKLYFVRETKSTLDSQERRTKENQKIQCGKRHFKAIDVDYGVVTKLADITL